MDKYKQLRHACSAEREMKREWGPHQKKLCSEAALVRTGGGSTWRGAAAQGLDCGWTVEVARTSDQEMACPNRFVALWHRRPECLKGGGPQRRQWEALHEGAAPGGIRQLAAGGRRAQRLAWLTEVVQQRTFG
jgi:hypothetical protein